MIFAEGGFFFGLVALALVIGFFGFFFVGALALFRFVGTVIRRVFFGDPVTHPPGSRSASAKRVHLCDNPQCRYMNVSSARFCARCGLRLRGGCQVDYHG